MHVVVMGCGRSGSQIARRLDEEGHSVSVIDKDPDAFHLLGIGFGGKTVRGFGFDRDALVQAGIERADAFIAVSSGDNSNVVSSVIAKDDFRVPKVITRVYDPRRAEIYRRLGIRTVAPVTWNIGKVMDLLFLERAYARETFGNAEVELMEFEVPPNLAGRTVRDFESPGEISVVVVERLGEAFIPVPGDQFRNGDVLQVAVEKSSMDKFKKMFFIA